MARCRNQVINQRMIYRSFLGCHLISSNLEPFAKSILTSWARLRPILRCRCFSFWKTPVLLVRNEFSLSQHLAQFIVIVYHSHVPWFNLSVHIFGLKVVII
jgi:hypothetical protein